MARLILAVFCVASIAVIGIEGHGRLMKPPNRSSLWRVPEFASQNPPQNYDDNQLYCGGTHQADIPGSNCGVCGDPLSAPAPRDNEINGKFYRGIIAGTYNAGQDFDIEVELTVAHKGFMEFRLCCNLGGGETQACFNQNVLQLSDGSGTKLPVDMGTGWYRTRARLPAGLRSDHCAIQWNYRAGNTWGQCEDGSQGSGCGPQETFRGCSDIKIV